VKENNIYKLLSACSAPYPAADDDARIRELIEQINDWDALLATSGTCRTTPALFDRLAAKDVPQHILQKMQRAAMANAVRNAILSQHLTKALNALKDADIPAITYKGPALASEAYDNPSLRMYDDLDIMVHKEDLKNAKQTLEKIGYSEILKLPEKLENSRFRPPRSYTLLHRDNTHNIDLSDRFTTNYLPFELPQNELWQHIRSVEIDGSRIQTLSLEHLILFLCVHGAKHLWHRPTWISDIAGLLQNSRNDIDWNRTTQLAKKQDVLRILLIGISLASKEHNIPIPPQLEPLIEADNKVAGICRELQQIIGITPGTLSYNKYKRARLYLKMLTKTGSRLRCIMLLTTTPNKDETKAASRYPMLYPLIRITRPLHLVYKLIRRK